MVAGAFERGWSVPLSIVGTGVAREPSVHPRSPSIIHAHACGCLAQLAIRSPQLIPSTLMVKIVLADASVRFCHYVRPPHLVQAICLLNPVSTSCDSIHESSNHRMICPLQGDHRLRNHGKPLAADRETDAADQVREQVITFFHRCCAHGLELIKVLCTQIAAKLI